MEKRISCFITDDQFDLLNGEDFQRGDLSLIVRMFLDKLAKIAENKNPYDLFLIRNGKYELTLKKENNGN